MAAKLWTIFIKIKIRHVTFHNNYKSSSPECIFLYLIEVFEIDACVSIYVASLRRYYYAWSGPIHKIKNKFSIIVKEEASA